MRKVVITGAKGFVGKELVKECKNKEIEVIEIDVIDCQDKNYYKADITSKDISKIIPENADAIIHLAALSRDPDCRNKAYDCFNLNVMGTLSLMDVAQKKNLKQFIFASTEWVYDRFENDEVKTEDSLIDLRNHTSEYAFSKLVSETNLRQKFQHGFCDVTILRFGIIYGPRKSNWSAVENIVNEVRTKDQITIGSLKTGRCFIHVSDVASGIIESIGLKGFNVLNLQGDRLITLKEIIETSKRIMNRNPEVIESTPEKISVRKISNKKIKETLNWKPSIDIETGIRAFFK